MTCIVGIAHEGSVTIGGDSAGSAGYHVANRADDKVFVKGEMVFGFCGSYRLGQLLRYALKIPKQPSKQSDHEFMCTGFVDAVRACLREGGLLTRKADEESIPGCFLVGYRGKLYQVEGDLQVGWRQEGFDSCGSGDEPALGALFASDGKPAGERLKLALDAATWLNSAVRPPYSFVTLAPPPAPARRRRR